MLKYYYKIIQLLETFINIFIAIAFFPRNLFVANKIKKRSGSIHILGNGPSLKNDLSRIVSNKESAAYMVVNAFATTDLYEQIKPEFYIIVDPAFFKNSTEERIIDIQTNTMKALISKTNWKLNLLIPFSAKKSALIKKINDTNSFIEIVFYKNIPVIGGVQWVNNLLFKYNLANPLYMNILIPAIFLSIKMNFNKILIWGADHSWHEDYKLGLDNYIYRNDKHFFDKGETGNIIKLTNSDGLSTKVHEEFSNFATVFKIHQSLDLFSQIAGCRIINLSSKTWIDAYERNI